MSLASIDLALGCEVARLQETPQEVVGDLHVEFIVADLRSLVDELDELLAGAGESVEMETAT